MTTIVQKEKFCKIIYEIDEDFLKLLKEHLSFTIAGAEFLPAYRQKYFNGKQYLINKKLEFYSGLLEYTKDFYKLHNKELNIIDERKKIIYVDPIDISYNLKKLNIVPRDYQERALTLLDNDRVIFRHATASGKSLTAALIISCINKEAVLYVISKELLHQFHNFFSQIFDQEIGIIGDGQCIIKPITIASIWTVGKSLGMKKTELKNEEDGSEEDFDESNAEKIKKYISTVPTHLLDECHVASSATIKRIYKYINPERLYGFSGTPVRDDNSMLLLHGILGSNNIDTVSASELILRNILARPFIKFLYVPGYANYTTNYNTVYADHIVNNTFRNNLIVSETKKLFDKGYQTLILFKTIKHGKIIRDLFKERGIEVEFLSGKDTEKRREEVKNNLLTKKSMIAVCSVIYDIGVDISTLSALILAGGGKSSVKTLQRVGRVIRDGQNKPHAAVIDFYDDIRYLKKHSLIRKAIYETEPEFVIKMPELKKK